MANQTDYKHVDKKFQHIVSLSDEERIQFINSPRWIGYPAANQVFEIMTTLINTVSQPRMPNLLLTGHPNNGKTTILLKFIERFSKPLYENTNKDDVILPILYVQAPPSPNEKDLYIGILQQLEVPFKYSDSVVVLRSQIIHVFRECKIKMLIIDEIHSVLTGTARQQQLMMNCIKYLCNELKIPMVLAGTSDAVRILNTDPQHASRFDVAELPLWKNDDNFKKVVGSFERTLPLKLPSKLNEPDKLSLIHTISEGCIGEVRKLLSTCAVDAINTNEEAITIKMLEDKLCWQRKRGIRNLLG